MSTPSSFPFSALSSLPLPQPPAWLMREAKQRVVLLLNHVLQQEPQAMERLSRRKGQVAGMLYGQIAMNLIATPVGLLDLAPEDAVPDLTLRVLDESPWVIVQTLLRGDKPRMEISGDVMLAAEVNWLVDHVRWDVEEDLSRIMGDVPAHSLMRVVRGAGEVLRKFVQGNVPTASAAASSGASAGGAFGADQGKA